MPRLPSKKIRFTKAALEGLPPAASGQRDRYLDTEERGLTLRVGPTGEKIFYFLLKAQGKTVQIKIGPFPDIALDTARRKAAEARIAVRSQGDPVQALGRPRRGHTVRDLFDWWIANHARARRKTWEEDVKVFERHLAGIANRQCGSITKAEARQLHQQLGETGGHATANRTWEMLRTIYNRARKYDVYQGENPTDGIDWYREFSRERSMQDHEVAAFMLALDTHASVDIRDYILLSLFTGQRQGNVLAARWDQVDWGARTWTIPESKNGLSIVVHLEAQDLALLQRRQASVTGEWVFPGKPGGRTGNYGKTGHLVTVQRPWEAIREAAGLKDLRLHDLRRTLGSWMADTGAALNVIGKTLGHTSPSATAIYARLSHRPLRVAKRRALAALSLAGNLEVVCPPEAREFLRARVRRGVRG